MDVQQDLLALGVSILTIIATTAISAAALLHRPLLQALVLSPYLVRHEGHVHRLLTAGFVHADWGHLFLNMITLFFFADRVIAKIGEVYFLGLYVSAVVVAFIPSTLRYSNRSGYSTLGASGAVAAVLFSAILLYPELELALLFIPLPVPGVIFGFAYLAYSAWHSRAQRDNINHDAHFYGAAYGILATYVLEPKQVERTVEYWLSAVS